VNNLPKHHGAGLQKRVAQCCCIGCIGLRPALYAAYGIDSGNIIRFNQSEYENFNLQKRDEIDLKEYLLNITQSI